MSYDRKTSQESLSKVDLEGPLLYLCLVPCGEIALGGSGSTIGWLMSSSYCEIRSGVGAVQHEAHRAAGLFLLSHLPSVPWLAPIHMDIGLSTL